MPPGPNGVGKGVTGATPVVVDEVLVVGEGAVVITGVLAELDVVVDVAGVLAVAVVVVVGAVVLVDMFNGKLFLSQFKLCLWKTL